MKKTFAGVLSMILFLCIGLSVCSGQGTIYRPYSPTQAAAPASKGDIITFGQYAQNQWGGRSSIEWEVLELYDNCMLLISRYGLEPKYFHNSTASVSWEQSDLRAWLNNEFYNNAFSASEKSMMRDMAYDNGKQDHVILLNREEARYYLPTNASRRCQATSWATNRGARMNNGYAWWWLRSSGSNRCGSDFVYDNGEIRKANVSYACNADVVVRPVIWIAY